MILAGKQNKTPQKCNRKKCLICQHALCTEPKVEIKSGDGTIHEVHAARFSCKSRNVIYIIFDKKTKVCYYVGHTGQSIESRIYQHTGGKKNMKGGNSKFKNGFVTDKSKHKIHFYITAISSHPSRVRRLEHEKEWIRKLKPSWNIQVEYHWWSHQSNEFVD